METRMGGQDVALEPVSDDEEEGFAPISYLANVDDEPGRILEHEETERVRSRGLAQALGSLDARSRRIIEARWLRENDSSTLHELAAEFGVSAERVRQIEAQAMKKMRALMAPA
jgi:RNA polymerase sigma-32 factor